MSTSSIIYVFFFGIFVHSVGSANVVCPGLPESQFCDCRLDCIFSPDWCACPPAQGCCSRITTDDTNISDDETDDSSSIDVFYNSTTESTFKIYSPDEAESICNLHSKVKTTMIENGFSKILCPFGVIIMGSDNYPDELLKYGANMVANLVDTNNDGVADDEVVLNHLSHNGIKGHGKAMMCGETPSHEAKESEFDSLLDYVFSCQARGDEDEVNRSTMFEEVFHMVHNGWAYAFPSVFGYDSFSSSVICRETARLQCVKPGWRHPENKCPDGAPFPPGFPASSPLQPRRWRGDCTYPSCDCVEFYRQAATLYMGWNSAFWYSPYMPKNKAGFMEMASEELLDAMSNETHHQPQEPLSGVYTYSNVQGTGCPPDPDPMAKFWNGEIKIKNGKNWPKRKDCTWLSEEGAWKQNKLCSMTEGFKRAKPARDVCTGTCNSC